MSMYNRYYVAKMKSPDYMIIFIKRNKLTSCNIDKAILQSIQKKNVEHQLQKLDVSYIVMDNLTIIKKYDGLNNQYTKLYLYQAICMVLSEIMGKY